MGVLRRSMRCPELACDLRYHMYDQAESRSLSAVGLRLVSLMTVGHHGKFRQLTTGLSCSIASVPAASTMKVVWPEASVFVKAFAGEFAKRLAPTCRQRMTLRQNSSTSAGCARLANRWIAYGTARRRRTNLRLSIPVKKKPIGGTSGRLSDWYPVMAVSKTCWADGRHDTSHTINFPSPETPHPFVTAKPTHPHEFFKLAPYGRQRRSQSDS
jgi:hypothetical protein